MLGEVFVTGMGIISGLGLGVNETLNSLLLSKSGIGKIKYLETINDIPCAEVNFSDLEMKKLLNLEEDSIVPRTALMGILAVKEVLNSTNFPLDGTYKVAFINSTTVGGMEKSELYYFDFLQNNSRNKYIEAHDCGSLTEIIADYFGGFNYVSTPSTACSSAANAVILGVNLIDAGIVDAAIVGGSECITKFHLNGFKSLMILDSMPCRPFDQNRAGLNLGEGAAFLLLESSKLLSSRKSKPLAQVKGYGNACDAYHQTASSPEGKGATLAMQAALKMSGLNAEDINYINAHGTGTLNNDESEGNAIINVFGKFPPHVSSTKSLTGHTTSASGGVEAVISILAINHDFIPANANFKTKMEALSFVPVKEVIRNIEVKNVLSNSFGFGGNNTSLIFSKVY